MVFIYKGIVKSSIVKRSASIVKAFAREEDGNIMITTAIGMIGIMSVVGFSLDYAALSTADSRGQSIADASALTASIYVKNYGREPNNKQEGLIGQYTASELGYKYPGWTQGGAEGVKVTISYDDINQEATATVEGKTVPFFSQVMGKNALNFSKKSVVKYYDSGFKDPASIVLVLDNSGSMGWDDKAVVFRSNGSYYTPSDAIPRITALESSVENFMDTLNRLVEDQTTAEVGTRVLRTGMLAYNANTVNARTVGMKWGTIADSKITAMQASGGTNSSAPLRTARSWMATEDAIHKAEHGQTPLKFAIFMTDGVNTSGGTIWEQEDGTGYWRLYNCNNGCRYSYASSASYPTYDFEGNGWEEGKQLLTANTDSLADCKRMENDGVRVYTIGFALEEGYYEQNYTYNGRMQYSYTSQETSDGAYAFLQGCASSTGRFIKAENAETLEEAFQTIGGNIIKEVIRISN